MKISNVIQKHIKILRNPKKFLQSQRFLEIKSMWSHKIAPYSRLDDKFWIEDKFYKVFGYHLNLKRPVTLNEKTQWVKLYDRNPIYTRLTDKIAVREYIEEKIGSKYLTKLWGVYEYPHEINWDSLPSQCVIKLTHGCGLNIICTNKDLLDIQGTIIKLQKWKTINHYDKYREWHYKNIHPRIIIEEYLNDGTGISPRDYKVYCFSGKPEYLIIGEGRQEGDLKFYYFDRNWNFCRSLSKAGMEAPPGFSRPKPEGIEELFECAEKLAKPFAFVRTDFYLIFGKTIFSELTFTPSGGFYNKRLPETDKILGNLYPLPGQKKG